MELPKTLAAPFRESTGRTQGILLCSVALISLTSLAGHLLNESILTNWAGPWSLTIPSASIFLMLGLQFGLKTNLLNSLLGAAIILASASTLFLDYQGYSTATAVAQICLALSFLTPERSRFRALAIVPAWLCILELTTLVLETKSGPITQFVENMSQPTALSGLALAYLALTASEPYAFRRPKFRLVHFLYTAGITTGLLVFNISYQKLGTDLSSIFITSTITALCILGISQRFENRRLNNRNSDLLETLDKTAIVVITDPQGRILHANDAFNKRYGFENDEIIGATHHLISSKYHDNVFWANVWETLQNGEIWQGKICNKTKSGEQVWLDATLSPLADEKGDPERFLAIYFDITDRIKNEANLLRSRDKQSSMLKSLQTMTEHRDRLIQLIAHDLRSPLATVIAIAESDQVDENVSSGDTITKMVQHTRKALAELEEFLAAEEALRIAQDSVPDESFDPELEILEEWQTHSLLARQKSIRVDLPKNDPYIFRGPRHLFIHVLRNLLSNAIKYTPENGRISIGLKKASQGLILTVDDSGPGIPPEKRSSVFSPFHAESQASKIPSPVKSLGIGLSVAYDLLKTKNGTMEVLDSPLGGARFQATLPGQTLNAISR